MGRGLVLGLLVMVAGCAVASGTFPTRLVLPDGRAGYSFFYGSHASDDGAVERAVAEKVAAHRLCPGGYDLVDSRITNRGSLGMTFDAVVACR